MVQETAPHDLLLNFLTQESHVFKNLLQEKSCNCVNIYILVKKGCFAYLKGQVIPKMANWSGFVDINMHHDLHKTFLLMNRRIPTYVPTTAQEKSCNFTSFLSNWRET